MSRYPHLPAFFGASIATAALVAGPAFAEAGSILDRPTFDRDNSVILIPFRGPAPRFETQSRDGGTRLIADFTGSQATMSTPYKLGIFHPLVSKVELTPMVDSARVRLTIALSSPGKMAVVPDVRRGVMRIQLGRDDMAGRETPPEPVSGGFGAGPTAPMAAAAGLGQGRVEMYPGQAVLTPRAPAIVPAVSPSLPPVRFAASNGVIAGTPASGEYVYRKAIPSENGRDVTEVQIRTPRRSAIDVASNIQNDAVAINVTPPGGMSAPNPGVPEGWSRPLPNEPFKLPGYRGEPVFKPVAAIDAILGYTLMSEAASTLGTKFSGAGSSLLGLNGHIPIGSNFNVNLQAETFGYTIASLQVPDATTRRDEFFGAASLEFLPIRRPWVLATGIGYWGRYVTQKNNILAPPTPACSSRPPSCGTDPRCKSAPGCPSGTASGRRRSWAARPTCSAAATAP